MTTRFSPCRQYRYTLWRQWADGDVPHPRYAMFIGLNPSTADEVQDDPTVRRCINFARTWGYDALCMTNIFGYRSTQPARMLARRDPIGPENDAHLRRLARGAAIVVAAWGTHGVHRGRSARVRAMLPTLHYLRMTKMGEPGHPLYLPGALTPTRWIR